MHVATFIRIVEVSIAACSTIYANKHVYNCLQLRVALSIPHNPAIHILRSVDIINLPAKVFTMRKARITEHKIIAVIKSVEAGRTVKDVRREAGSSEATYSN